MTEPNASLPLNSPTENQPLVEIKNPIIENELKRSSLTKTGQNSGQINHEWASDPRMKKFSKFSKMCQLNRMFGQLGRWVAISPYAFLISAIIMSSLCFGMFKMQLRDRVRDGYTPTTSPSRHETDILREFFGSKSDPIMTIVLLLARDKGSMHRPEYLQEALRIHKHIQEKVNVTINGKVYAFSDFCGTGCFANYFFEYLAQEFIKISSGEFKEDIFRAWTRLDFPISNIFGVDFHFERNFYGVQTVDSKENETKSDSLSEIHRFTNIRNVEIIQLNYKGETLHGLDEDALAAWEMALYQYSQEFKSDLIELSVIGSEIVDYEMNKESQMMGPFVGLGFVSMILFALCSTAANSYFYRSYNMSVNVISVVATVCSLLAVGSTFGLYGWLGMRINSVCLIMPFLTLGIGVNDSFMMAHAYFRHKQISPDVVSLMQSVYAEVGPSITITTLTNVVTFLIGSMMPTAEFQLFCTAAAMALGYCYIFTIICFGPVLVIIHTQKPSSFYSQPDSKFRKKMNKVLENFLNFYSKLMCQRLFHLFNFVVFSCYMGFAIYGAINITARLDTEKILPKQSKLRRPHEIVAHIVWKEYYPVQVFINKPFNMTNVQQMHDFNNMMKEFYAMPQSKGRRHTINWLDDYKKYYDENQGDFNFDFHSETGIVKDEGDKPETGYDLRYFKQFLSSPIYKHHKMVIKYIDAENWRDIRITQFTFTLVYAGLENWDQRIQIMIKWRQIANNYKNSLETTVWETNGMFVDQMLSLKGVSLQSGILTMACMLVVCVIFIQNPLGVIAAVCSIASIVVGVIGYLYFWDLDLDPASLGAVLMSVGMSVDFTAHTIYAYLRTEIQIYDNGRTITVPLNTEFERMKNCVSSIMYPMFQGGFSTIVCVLPLLCIPDYIPLVFLKTIVLVVIFGLYHGVVVLPGFMVLFTPYSESCYANLKKRIFGENFQENSTEVQPIRLTAINDI